MIYGVRYNILHMIYGVRYNILHMIYGVQYNILHMIYGVRYNILHMVLSITHVVLVFKRCIRTWLKHLGNSTSIHMYVVDFLFALNYETAYVQVHYYTLVSYI